MKKKLKKLHVLERIKSLTLDQLQAELGRFQEHHERLLSERYHLEKMEYTERQLAADQPELAQTLVAFGDINRLHQQTLTLQIDQLQIEIESLKADIQDHYQESKKLESMVETTQEALRHLDQYEEQKAFDQLSEIRHQQKQKN